MRDSYRVINYRLLNVCKGLISPIINKSSINQNKEEIKMIEIRETAEGKVIYVDGYYVGVIYNDGTAE